MSEMSDFQRAFLQKGTGQKLFTEVEFNAELSKAMQFMKDQFMDATHFAIIYENEECAKMVEAAGHKDLAETMRKRIKNDNPESTVPAVSE
jgi:ABC-type thiamine transport system substrate-binding protein